VLPDVRPRSEYDVLHRWKPWHENLNKRQVRAPKIHVRDSGLLHSLLGINTFAQLDAHPKSGASLEGFAIDQAIQAYGSEPNECQSEGSDQASSLTLQDEPKKVPFRPV
jgi:predicted AAA+ superfamily ATPase